MKADKRLQTKKAKHIASKVKEITDQMKSDSDPNGSYTGQPLDKSERPVQDADDL